MKTMSENEALARKILASADEYNVPVYRAADYMDTELPAITPNECRRIAANTRYSRTVLRRVFPSPESQEPNQ